MASYADPEYSSRLPGGGCQLRNCRHLRGLLGGNRVVRSLARYEAHGAAERSKLPLACNALGHLQLSAQRAVLDMPRKGAAL